MVLKKEIILKHKKILDNIKQHNKNYYTFDNPKISDEEFDKLKIDAQNLEKEYSF